MAGLVSKPAYLRKKDLGPYRSTLMNEPLIVQRQQDLGKRLIRVRTIMELHAQLLLRT